MKKSFFLPLLLGLLLSSCHDQQPIGHKVVSFDLLASTKEIGDLSEYIEDVKIIDIKTDSLVFITPGKILINNDKFIVLSGGQVYQMDTTGVVLGQIGRIGNGPGEYISVSDICFDSGLDKLLCQDSRNRVLTYDAQSFEFIQTVDSDIFGNSSNAIVPFQNNGFALLVNNPAEINDYEDEFYCLKCYNQKGHLVEEKLMWEDFNMPLSFSPNSVQGPDNTYFLSFIPSEGIFYKDSCGVLSSFIHLSFGNESLPFRYAFDGNEDPWNKVRDIFESRYYKCVTSLCMTDGVMYCYAFGPQNSRYHFVFDPTQKMGIRWRASNFGGVMSAIASDQDYFYYCYTSVPEEAKTSPYYSPDILRSTIEGILGEKCPDDGTPVIVKIKYSIHQ